MQNLEALILNWSKRSKESDWVVRVELPSGILMDIPIGKKGVVPTGPALSSSLEKLQNLPESYPYQFDMTTIADKNVRTLHVRFLGERPVRAEVSIPCGTYIEQNMHQTNWVSAVESLPSSDLHFVQIQEESAIPSMKIMSVHEAVSEYSDKENRYWIFLKDVNVLDGDTITGYITGYAWPNGKAIPPYIGEQNMKEYASRVSVRYLGVDTFEVGDRESRNSRKARLYGLDKKILNAAAEEAKAMNTALVKESSITAVSLQYNAFEDRAVPDSVGRLLGVVYGTTYRSYEEASNALKEGSFRGININKEMLKPMYSKYQSVKDKNPVSIAVPLAEYTGNNFADESLGINVVDWAYQLNLNLPPDEKSLDRIRESQYQGEDTEAVEGTVTEQQKGTTYVFKGNSRQDKKLGGYINNDLSFVPATDDRLEDGIIYEPSADQEEDYPWDYTKRVRIGDVFIPIPPLSIKMDKQYQSENIKTMRTSSSLQKNIGSVRNILTLDLYYDSSDDINGTETVGYYTKNKNVKKYYMDGLRPLLAQFKKAPFLPIDNDYVNNSLGVHNVALRNLQVETVPGFPEALKATLILEEFDSAPYLMGKKQLGDMINYPLLRWHYQRLLQKPDIYEPWRTYLPEVQHLDNNVSFSIVNEEQLSNRNEIIRQFRGKQTPSDFKEEILDIKKDKGKENHDVFLVRNSLEEYDKFMDEWENKTIMKKHGLEYESILYLPVVAGESIGHDATLNILNDYSPKETKAGKELAIAIYGEDPDKRGISNKRISAYGGLWVQTFNTPADCFYPARTLASGRSVMMNFPEPVSHLPKEIRETIANNYFPGYFQIYLTSEKYKKVFSDCKVTTKNSPMAFVTKDSFGNEKGRLYIIPAGDVPGGGASKQYLTNLKKMIKEAEAVDFTIKSYEQEYNAMAALINQTEEDMPMDEYQIADLVPISLTVSMENNFSSAQVQSAQTPTMQFFGAMDPEVQITFETTEEGVKDIEALLRKIGEYVREYREGIVSGFMGLSNSMVELFGIRTVIPRNVQYTSVPGYPDRTLVTLTCSAFDKTQRRQEALYGYTAGHSDEKLRDRAFDNYDPGKDGMYVHERMRQMELYPDLEMAKIEELNADLPYLNAGLKKWENRSNQVFLDPDFYISTEKTYRSYLKEILDGQDDLVFRWEDANGYVIDSSLRDEDPLKFSSIGKSQAEFEKEAQETEYVNPLLMWEGYDEEDATETVDESEDMGDIVQSVSTGEPPKQFVSKDVEKYVKQVSGAPQLTNWKKWPGNGNKTRADYDKWRSSLKSEIDQKELWYHLALTVMDAFEGSNIEYANMEKTSIQNRITNAIPRTGDSNLEKKYRIDKALGSLSWMDPNEYFQRMCMGIVWSTKKDMENGKKRVDRKDFSHSERVLGEFSNEKKFPFQRVMSYLRSLILTESNGIQTSGPSPYFYDQNQNGVGTKVGIMGAKIAEAKTRIEAERLIFDWKYNIEHVVKEIASVFKKAEKSSFVEIFVQRMDWAIASRSWTPLPKIITSNSKNDDVSDGYLNGKINPELDVFYQKVMTARKNDVAFVAGDDVPALYQDLNGNIIPEIFSIYTARILTNGVSQEKQEERLEEDIAEKQKSMSQNIPIGTQEERLKGMFVDMYQHDQKGRMLRAFPTFSLQLIDEGKWYNNFRTWDNFYGYNAIHSIDVYKSRKIAADTAVIEMSNMYGGLTSKRKDMEYKELNNPSFFSSQFWENYVLGIPTEDVLEARKEIFKSMMLEAGARIHLRTGYGSDARNLPIMFNGTVTEVSGGDVVQIMAQSDGLELTNMINGNPSDENRSWLGTVTEPRDFIGELMTSKGNWLKDMVSNKTEGKYFKDSPLGIAHFGSPIQAPSGTINPFDSDYGEVMQNVYSQNGTGVKSQWMNGDGTSISSWKKVVSSVFTSDVLNAAGDNDEDNIVVKLYGNTPWDIIQTFALCTHDYIAMPFPFQFRTSLFFGKAHWPVVYDYDTEFNYDEGDKKWRKNVTHIHRKTFSQAHMATSEYDILSNDMKVSSEGVYNNVVVEYDGHVTPPLQADNDIAFDQQRTANVQANIISRKKSLISGLLEKQTTESQAAIFGHSTVRDFMKDMYKGSYTILGDGTIKPHDSMYLSDTIQDIQGVHLVKAVHHSLSSETGFISIIEPDANIVNFDGESLFMADKVFSIMNGSLKNVLISTANIAGGYVMAGAVGTKLMAHMANVQKYLGKYSTDTVAKYSAGIMKRQTQLYLKTVGKVVGDDVLVLISRNMKNMSMTEVAGAMKASRKRIDSLISIRKANKDTYKTIKRIYNSQNGGFVSRAYNSAFTFNRSEAVIGLLDKSKDVTTAMETASTLYKTGVGKNAKFVTSVSKLASTSNKALRFSGKMIGGLLTKPFVWGIIFDVALRVVTTSLIEMWSRKKQNAECIKVFPLNYKGQPWVAAMRGHRGSVWGSNPSLNDRILNARFNDGLSQSTGESIMSFLPKVMNLLSAGDESSQMYDKQQRE